MIDGLTYVSKPHRNAFTVCRFNQLGNQTIGEVLVLVVNFGPRLVDVPLGDLPPFIVVAQQCAFNAASHAFNAQVLAVSSSLARNAAYSLLDKVNIASGAVQLGADQGVLLKFDISPSNFLERCP